MFWYRAAGNYYLLVFLGNKPQFLFPVYSLLVCMLFPGINTYFFRCILWSLENRLNFLLALAAAFSFLLILITSAAGGKIRGTLSFGYGFLPSPFPSSPPQPPPRASPRPPSPFLLLPSTSSQVSSSLFPLFPVHSTQSFSLSFPLLNPYFLLHLLPSSLFPPCTISFFPCFLYFSILSPSFSQLSFPILPLLCL